MKDAAQKGVVICLIGVSSAGKTTLAHALQAVFPTPCFHLSKDMFMLHMAPQGLVRAAWPEQYAACTALFHDTVRLFSDRGHPVVADSVRLEKPYADQMRGYPALVVRVTCGSLAELRRRERMRANRSIGQAEGQLRETDAETAARCDMTVDTFGNTPQTCAAQILARLRADGRL